MLKTFGKMPSSLPDGFLVAVDFPVLCMLDTDTGDHRLLDGEGGDSRDLPLSIKMQERTSFGHEGAILSGALFEVTFDPESKLASGRGFLLDDEAGQKHAVYIKTGAMRGNSVDLAEVKARYEEDISEGGEWDYRIRFTKWSIAATTGVSTPAFRQARAEITAAMTDEILASLRSDPMEPLVCEFEEYTSVVIDMDRAEVEIPTEMLASGIVQSYEMFFHPEGDKPQKIVVDANNHVYGHLGLWDTPHDGIQGQRVTIPRPTDNYNSFNKPGVLTDRGIVNTGMIMAYGGHRPSGGRDNLDEVYGGTENAWSDVRITEGVHGPWISGVVRPGVADETVYVARASRISGHWLGDRLKAIVSVNVEGFDVAGNDDELLEDLVAGYAFGTRDGELELVASFPAHYTEPTYASLIPQGMTFSLPEGYEIKTYTGNSTNAAYPAIEGVTYWNVVPTPAEPAAAEDVDENWGNLQLVALLLDDDDDEDVEVDAEAS